MGRSELRAVLSGIGADAPPAQPGRPRAVIAMLERHACRLEQVPWPARANAEPLARALRSAQRLYDLAAVTVGDGGDLLIDTARDIAARSGARDAVGRDPAGRDVDQDQVLAAPAVAMARDAFGRLRTVLGGRAGVVVVLPARARLTAEAGLAGQAAARLLLAALHAFGAAEPDAFVVTGCDGEPDPAHDAVAGFYGAALIRVGAGPGGWTTPGVEVRPGLAPGDGWRARPGPHDGPLGGEFCVATPAEVDPALTPAEIRTRLAAATSAASDTATVAMSATAVASATPASAAESAGTTLGAVER